MFNNGMRPVHPGEVLREDYLKPMDLSANAPERRGVSADTAVRPSCFFGGAAQSWRNLQTAYDLHTAELDDDLQTAVMAVHPLRLRPA